MNSRLKRSEKDDSTSMTPEEWLQHINTLWKQGNEKEAKESLKQFFEIYPDYSLLQIKDKLPKEIDLSEYTH